MDDIGFLLHDVPRPVVFDVGANTGQSVANFRRLLPDSTLHSFEPGRRAFQELSSSSRGLRNVHLVNAAVGSAPGRLTLIENEYTDMSSFLRPSTAAWGAVVAETEVEVTTVDGYCAEHGIDRIDLLKIDTQGYELEVLRGADGMLAAGGIGLVYLEVTFIDMYEGLPPFDVLYRFLLDRGFRLVTLDNFHMHWSRILGWCDALFAHETFYSAPREDEA
jgi:FkbM family methyltransferase